MFASFTSNAATLIVAAAADLAGLEPSLAAAFARQTGQKVRFATAASGILASQIGDGAPFDVFLSADEKYVTDLAARGRIVPASVRVYALGRLGLWSRDGKIHNIKDLLGDERLRLAIANPEFAPYGRAARQLLVHLGLWDRLRPKIVYGESVTQAFQFAETGNADAAITSWTLVYNRGGVLLPAEHAPIRQAAGVVAGGGQMNLAGRFVTFLGSAECRALLSRYGLTPP